MHETYAISLRHWEVRRARRPHAFPLKPVRDCWSNEWRAPRPRCCIYAQSWRQLPYFLQAVGGHRLEFLRRQRHAQLLQHHVGGHQMRGKFASCALSLSFMHQFLQLRLNIGCRLRLHAQQLAGQAVKFRQHPRRQPRDLVDQQSGAEKVQSAWTGYLAEN